MPRRAFEAFVAARLEEENEQNEENSNSDPQKNSTCAKASASTNNAGGGSTMVSPGFSSKPHGLQEQRLGWRPPAYGGVRPAMGRGYQLGGLQQPSNMSMGMPYMPPQLRPPVAWAEAPLEDMPEPMPSKGPPRRVIVLRHGSRPDYGVDPSLDSVGERQIIKMGEYFAAAEGSASQDSRCPVKAIFCSPFIRAMQTALPVAKGLGLPIFVEWGFCELLAAGHSFREDPLPFLRSRDLRYEPFYQHLDLNYRTAVTPEYPDVRGRLNPFIAGDDKRREKALSRHRQALRAALRHANGGSVLVVGHGATHDFVAGALCPAQHPKRYHTPYCVPHGGVTEIIESDDGWQSVSFGSTPWSR